MSSERRPTKKYRVRLGLVEVVVEGRSKEDAIRLARTKVSCDMPRLYDIIHGDDDVLHLGDAETLEDQSATVAHMVSGIVRSCGRKSAQRHQIFLALESLG